MTDCCKKCNRGIKMGPCMCQCHTRDIFDFDSKHGESKHENRKSKPDKEAKVGRLEKRIDELEQRIEKLEKRGGLF